MEKTIQSFAYKPHYNNVGYFRRFLRKIKNEIKKTMPESVFKFESENAFAMYSNNSKEYEIVITNQERQYTGKVTLINDTVAVAFAKPIEKKKINFALVANSWLDDNLKKIIAESNEAIDNESNEFIFPKKELPSDHETVDCLIELLKSHKLIAEKTDEGLKIKIMYYKEK